MAGKAKAPDTVRLEKEIRDWQGKREQFTREVEAARATAAQAGTARNALLLAARAEGDTAAQRALDENTVLVSRAEREVQDLITVLGQIDDKLVGLDRELKVASRAAAVDQLRALAEKRLAADAMIETATAALVPAIEEWLRCSNAMAQTAAEWDFPNAETFGRRFLLTAYVGQALPAGVLATRAPFADQRVTDLAAADREALDTLLGRLEPPAPADKAAA